MIISFNKIDETTDGLVVLHMCTTFSFERILDEVSCMQMSDIISDSGTIQVDPSEPFMLNHIYLN
mgnify:CR=1 FL=1